MLVKIHISLTCFGDEEKADNRDSAGPAHAVYFGTYEVVKEMAGGNVDDGHHPLAAGKCTHS